MKRRMKRLSSARQALAAANGSKKAPEPISAPVHFLIRFELKSTRIRCAVPPPSRSRQRPCSNAFAAGGPTVDDALPAEVSFPVDLGCRGSRIEELRPWRSDLRFGIFSVSAGVRTREASHDE
jgi:hypothetical protein